MGTLVSPHCVTPAFSKLLAKRNLRKIRFHNLRYSAATNMHQLTGDFYTVGVILGHSLEGHASLTWKFYQLRCRNRAVYGCETGAKEGRAGRLPQRAVPKRRRR